MARHSAEATFVVAASNASPESLDRADYVCDGVADDVQIQLAIAALAVLGGGKLVLTEGLFTTAADITGTDNLTIEGQGRATLVQAAYNTAVAIFDLGDCDDVQVRNFAIDGQLGTYVCGGIDVLDCKRILVEGMQFYNIYWGVGNDGTGTVEDLMVRNCYGYNIYRGFTSILGGLRISIIGNDIIDAVQEGNAGSAIGFSWNDAFAGCQFITVSHNHIWHTAVVVAGGNPYSMGIDLGHETTDAVADHNTVYQAGQGIYTEYGARTIIDHNIIVAPGQEGILIEGDRITVSNNEVYYGDKEGIKLFHTDDGAQWNDIVIEGNIVYDCNQAANEAGIFIQGGNRVLIQGNSSTSNFRGVALYAPNNTFNSHITIVDNDLSGNGSAAYTAGTAGTGTNTDLRIHDNCPYSLPDPGNGNAIPVWQSGYCILATGGAETRSLAAPTFIDQRIKLFLDVHAGNCVVTSAVSINVANNTQMTFAAVSQQIVLEGITAGGALEWSVVANDGVGLA